MDTSKIFVWDVKIYMSQNRDWFVRAIKYFFRQMVWGMEEGEFSEAREDLGFLEKDYLDVVSEQASDEEEEDEY